MYVAASEELFIKNEQLTTELNFISWREDAKRCLTMPSNVPLNLYPSDNFSDKVQFDWHIVKSIRLNVKEWMQEMSYKSTNPLIKYYVQLLSIRYAVNLPQTNILYFYYLIIIVRPLISLLTKLNRQQILLHILFILSPQAIL